MLLLQADQNASCTIVISSSVTHLIPVFILDGDIINKEAEESTL